MIPPCRYVWIQISTVDKMDNRLKVASALCQLNDISRKPIDNDISRKPMNALASKKPPFCVDKPRFVGTKEPFLHLLQIQNLPCLGHHHPPPPPPPVHSQTRLSALENLQLNSRASFNLMISSSDLMRGNEFNNSLTTRYARVQFSTPSRKEDPP